MKRSLSSQFIVILLVPIIVIISTNYAILSYIRKTQNENAKNYCETTVDNININISSLITSMKKTATVFSTKSETQSFLISEESAGDLERQKFGDIIDLCRSYTPDLVDILIWDNQSTTSMISYISLNMEQFAKANLIELTKETDSCFRFYLQPETNQPYLMYFVPVYMTSFSKDFGKKIGSVVVICKSNTLSRLVHSTKDILIHVEDTETGQLLYSNNLDQDPQFTGKPSFISELPVPSTKLAITGSIFDAQQDLLSNSSAGFLIILAIQSLFFILYIAAAVNYVIIKPIHRLNEEIENMDYGQEKMALKQTSKNEIGSIASHMNTLLAKSSALNKKNIASQARLYEMELSKKQTQLYAYQSQINPHFLYNMLQCMRSISLLQGMKQIAQICTNMADLFRYSIKGANYVYLKDELEIIDKYLYMITVRFQDKISYQMEADPQSKDVKIPKMILQPLVENAIFHGLESSEGDGFLKITSFIKGDCLMITIQDNGIGFSEENLRELRKILEEPIPDDINATFNEQKGLGIINIHNKIRLYEGEAYGISIESEPFNTVVTICLKK